MYFVDDIARYIIDYSWDRKKTVSNLRLQKILYFVQAEFLVTKGEPCFDEDIYAWSLGPVVPQVYHMYKKFGNISIPTEGTSGKEYGIADEDIVLLNEIIDECNKHSTSTLVQWTHSQEPWIKASNSGFNKLISKSSIKQFFEEV